MFATLALIIILFEGGIHLNVRHLAAAAGDTLAISLTTLAMTALLLSLLADLLLGVDFPTALLIGIGLAILVPVVPYALELLALRRLTTAAFGTLMSLEPAFAMLIGLAMLHQVPGLSGVVGICFVVTAGIGATRSGTRSTPPVPADDTQQCDSTTGARYGGLS